MGQVRRVRCVVRSCFRFRRGLAAAFGKLKVSSARAVAMAKERDAVITKYEERPLDMELLMDLSDKKMVGFETQINKLTQERNVSGVKTELLSLEAQCVP